MATATTLKAGMKFNAPYADGNPEWTLVKKSGRSAWIAVAESDLDWKGTTKAFTVAEITHYMNMARVFENLMTEHDRFYHSLAVGSIVHYNNGFGEFVRCEVTADHKLMPIALVGNWRSHDLPRRRPNGEIDYPYHVRKMMEKETMEPNFTNIWEASTSLQKQYPNPANLTPVDLSVPEMTDEQAEIAKWEQTFQKAQKMLSSRFENKLSARESVEQVQEFLYQEILKNA